MKRFLLILILAIVGTLSGAVAFLESSYGKRVVIGIVERQLNSLLNGRFVLGALTGDYFHELSVYDAMLYDKEGARVAHVPYARLRLRVHPFQKTKIELLSLLIDQPDLRLRLPLRPLFKPSDAEKNGGWPEFLSVANARIELRSGHFEASKKGKPLAELHPIDLLVRLPESVRESPRVLLSAFGKANGMPAKLRAELRPRRPVVAPGALSGLAKDGAVPIEGELSASLGKSELDVSTSGTVDPNAPRRSQLELAVSKFHYELDEGTCRSVGFKSPARFHYDPTRAFPVGRARIEACGAAMNYTADTHAANVTVDSLRLEPFGVLKAQAKAPQTEQVKSLSVAAELVAPRGKVSLKLDARGEDLLGDPYHSIVSADLKAQDFDGGSVTASASARMQSGDLLRVPAKLSATVKQFDLGALLAFQRMPLKTDPKIKIDLSAELSGSVAEPRGRLTGKISEMHGELASLEADLAGTAFKSRLHSSRAPIDGLLPVVTDVVSVEKGTLSADFSVEGKFASPSYHGTADLHADRLQVLNVSSHYRDVSLKLSADERRIVVDTLRAKGGPGTFEAHGDLVLDHSRGLDDFKISAVLKNFQAVAIEHGRARASGKLDLAFSRADSSFRGDLHVDEGVLELPEQKKNLEPLGDLDDVVVLEKGKEADEGSRGSFFSALHGAVHVRAPGRFWIRSSDMQIELSADLSAGLNPRLEPREFVIGTAKAHQGFVDFLGRRLEIREAVAEFTGHPNHPRLVAEAVYKSTPYNILVTVDGDLAALKPKITSDPAGLSQDESIGVLLTGSPDYNRSAMSSSASGGRIVTGAVSGWGFSQLKKELGPLLPVDTFSADLSTDTPGGKVEFGRYLSDKLFLKYNRDFDPIENLPYNRLSLDYRLGSRWSIETSRSDIGTSALDLLWRINY